jgi:ribosomal protein S18 acetylase RimI-like enzyme
MTDNLAPAGASDIRAATPADAAAIAAVHVASWHETYAGLIPESMLTSLSVEDRTVRWARILGAASDPLGSSVFVAERGGEVVGFASGGVQRDSALLAGGFAGEISAIYLLRRAQKAGTGRRLMAAVAQSLRDKDRHAANLWVLRDNQPARRFYERLGGEIVGEKEDRRDEATLVELAYGWRDLGVLAGS